MVPALTLVELQARWAELPMISHGAHKAGDGVCLLEKVARARREPHTDHPESVSPMLAALGRSLNDFFTDKRFAEVLAEQSGQLDALGPRIAFCAPNLEREIACLPMLIQVSLSSPLAGSRQQAT